MKNQNIRFHWSIDQLQIISNNLDLDIIDWSIYEVMKQFFLSGKCEKKQFNGDTYYRYEWQNIPEQAPILKISTKAAVYRRYENLSKANFLHPMELPDGTISKRFFRLGEMHEIVSNKLSDIEFDFDIKKYLNKNKKLGESNTIDSRKNKNDKNESCNDLVKSSRKTSHPKKQTHIYLMRCLKTGKVKIGESKNPQKRLSEVKRKFKTPIELLFFSRPCLARNEADLHCHFMEKYVASEWFSLNENDIQFVKNYNFITL